MIIGALLIASTGHVLASPAGATVTSSGTLDLRIESDGAGDPIVVTCAAGMTKVNGSDPDSGPLPCELVEELTVDAGGGGDAVNLSGYSAEAGFTGVEFRTQVYGGGGDDTAISPPIGSTFIGDTGDDTFVGGDGHDQFLGDTGEDRATGGGAFDRLYGGWYDESPNNREGRRSADILDGGDGDDIVSGGRGDDVVRGGAGNDVELDGGTGNDTVKGGDGADKVSGDDGNDRAVGGKGRDDLDGGFGSDRLKARDGTFDRVDCGRIRRPDRDLAIVDPGRERREAGCRRIRV